MFGRTIFISTAFIIGPRTGLWYIYRKPIIKVRSIYRIGGQCINQNIERKYFETRVTSWLSSYLNQHLASLNISETAQETIKLWRTLWKPWHNCIWKQIKTDFLQGQKIFNLPPELCTSTNLGRNYKHLVLQRRQTRVVWYIPAYNQYK